MFNTVLILLVINTSAKGSFGENLKNAYFHKFKIIGIPVAEFQMDGLFTESSYMNYNEGLGYENISDFTFCLRQNLNYLRSWSTYSVSFSNAVSDNAFTVVLEKPKDINLPLILGICKYRYIYEECVFFQVGMKIHQEWHHACFVYSTSDDGNGEITTTAQLYYDGSLVQTSNQNNLTLSGGICSHSLFDFCYVCFQMPRLKEKLTKN